MSNIDTGGMAFPIKGPIMTSDELGMTLRDYFAAKAMQTMLGWDNDSTNWQDYAEDAYRVADAMLEARNK